jgi:hypothetical protein
VIGFVVLPRMLRISTKTSTQPAVLVTSNDVMVSRKLGRRTLWIINPGDEFASCSRIDRISSGRFRSWIRRLVWKEDGVVMTCLEVGSRTRPGSHPHYSINRSNCSRTNVRRTRNLVWTWVH